MTSDCKLEASIEGLAQASATARGERRAAVPMNQRIFIELIRNVADRSTRARRVLVLLSKTMKSDIVYRQVFWVQ